MNHEGCQQVPAQLPTLGSAEAMLPSPHLHPASRAQSLFDKSNSDCTRGQ